MILENKLNITNPAELAIEEERRSKARAKEMYDEGKDIYEIKDLIEEVAKTAVTFIVPNSLEQLKKGNSSRTSYERNFIIRESYIYSRWDEEDSGWQA